MKLMQMILSLLVVAMFLNSPCKAMDKADSLDRIITVPTGQYPLAKSIELLAKQSGMGIFGAFTPTQLGTVITFDEASGSTRKYLDSIAEQAGCDWSRSGNFIVWAAATAMSAPPPLKDQGWLASFQETRPTYLKPIIIHTGENASQDALELIQSLSVSQRADLFDGEKLPESALSGSGRYYLETLLYVTSQETSKIPLDQNTSISVTPIPWYAASFYYSLMSRVLPNESPSIASTGAQLISWQGIALLSDLLTELSESTRVQLSCDKSLKDIKITGYCQACRPQDIVTALGAATGSQTRLLGRAIYFELPSGASQVANIALQSAPDCTALSSCDMRYSNALCELISPTFPAIVLTINNNNITLCFILFPHHPQLMAHGGYNCGVTSLFVLLGLQGHPASDKQRLSVSRYWSQSLISMAELADLSQTLHSPLKGVAGSLKDVSHHLPCILNVSPKHFLVLKHLDRDTAEVNDNGVNQQVSRKDLERRYTGFALIRLGGRSLLK